MRLSIFQIYPEWFWMAFAVFAILDFVLIWKHIRNPKEDFGELIARIVGSNFFGFYLTYRIALKYEHFVLFPEFQTWFGWIQWGLIVFPFVIFFWSYLFRVPARESANRFREIVFPLFCAVLPFGVYESANLVYWEWIRKTPDLVMLIKPFYPGGYLTYHALGDVFIFLGDLIALWGLIYLRRSFSIMAEVREVKLEGAYRFIRHPMYLGEILATFGFCFLNFSVLNIVLTLFLTVCLMGRAKIEEAKIKSVYPEYKTYQNKTGFMFPKKC